MFSMYFLSSKTLFCSFSHQLLKLQNSVFQDKNAVKMVSRRYPIGEGEEWGLGEGMPKGVKSLILLITEEI